MEKQKAKVVIGDASEILSDISLKLGLPELNTENLPAYPERDFLNEFILWADKIEPISKIVILGDLWDYIGKWEYALKFFYSGYSLAQKSYDKHTSNLLMNRLASIFYKKGKYDDVIKYCNLAMKNAKEFPIAPQLYEYTHRLQLLGLVESHTNLQKSIGLYQQALSYQERLEEIQPKYKYLKADILLNVAIVFYKAKHFDEAKEWYISALSVYDEFGDIHGRASVLAGIGNLLLKQEKYDECLIYYKEAEYLFSETGNILKLSKILHALAITYYKNNKPKEAKKYAEHSLVYYEIMADHEGRNKIRELLRVLVD